MSWLSSELKQEVREAFEPQYNRQLSDNEVIEIADNLANFVESVLKFKCKKYEDKKKN